MEIRRILDHLISSPCVAVCRMDADSGLCIGCYRTIDEISGWPQMTGEEKTRVNRMSSERKAQAESAGKAG